MLYRILADGVMVVHFAFIIFVAIGAFLAWRWPAVVWLHLPALAWGIATVTIGFPCPLTPLEKRSRRLAGDEGYEGGFVDHYIEDVIYPDRYSATLRALAVVTIIAGYGGLRRRRYRSIATCRGSGSQISRAGRRETRRIIPPRLGRPAEYAGDERRTTVSR